MRVMIAGAGLGGLCLAHGLLRAGIEAEVFERDAGITARFQGYRIGLSQTGLAALHECLPEKWHPVLDQTLGEMTGARRQLGPDLNVLGELPPRTAMAADRHVLRSLLYAGLDGRVRFGRELASYEIAGDGVVAHFADGTTSRDDLLVGADGVGSAVRRQLAPGLVPDDTGVRFVVGRTALTDRYAALVPGFGTVVRGPDCTMLLGLMKFGVTPRVAARAVPGLSLPDVGDYVRWVLSLPVMDDPDRYGPQVIDEVGRLIKDWHPVLRDLVAHADPGNSTQLAIRVVRPSRCWAPGPVTMLGDAVHATSPSGGNGANTALRDAALLARRIAGAAVAKRPLAAAVQAYEDEMLTYGADAVRASLEQLPTFA